MKHTMRLLCISAENWCITKNDKQLGCLCCFEFPVSSVTGSCESFPALEDIIMSLGL